MKIFFFKIISNFNIIRSIYFTLLILISFLHKKNYKILFTKKIVLIALNDLRFKFDLEILEKNSNYIFFRFPYVLQRRLFNPIIIRKKLKDEYKEFQLLDNKKNFQIKDEIIFKYKNYFNIFFKLIKAKSVFSAAVHYKFDFLVGEIAKECNLKYIILHKENFSPLKSQQENKIKFYSNYFKSRADLIITHNLITKKILSKNILSKNKIFSIGALRFYDYYKKIQKKNYRKNSKKRVTLFSFTLRSGIYGNAFNSNTFFVNKGWVKLFQNVHRSIYELSIENPDIEFIIKTKWDFEWHQQIFKDIGYPKKIPNNLIITSKSDVLKLITSSSTIVAFNSTAILESAIFGHRVICPDFNEVNKYDQFVMHKVFKKKVTLAKSSKDLKKKIIDRLNAKQKAKPLMIEEFEKYISQIKKNVLRMYIKKIDKILTS